MKTVLVTGAGSGIGRCIAERLAAQGHRVWAGARRREHIEALGRVAGVVPVALDVRDAAQVEAVRRRLADEGGVLHGLVSNAGLGGLGLLPTWSDDELHELFDVNVLGPLRLTRALLPLLLDAGDGRIVHIGSQGGSITSRFYGPYTATKHALEALAACQRAELAPHGVQVSIVQPGGVVSEIGANAAPSNEARARRATPPFDTEAQALLAALAQPAAFDPAQPESAGNRRLSPPSLVAEAVEHALFDAAPRARYLVGTRWEGMRVVDALIDRLLDADEGVDMGLGRDALLARLDERLAERRRQ